MYLGIFKFELVCLENHLSVATNYGELLTFNSRKFGLFLLPFTRVSQENMLFTSVKFILIYISLLEWKKGVHLGYLFAHYVHISVHFIITKSQLNRCYNALGQSSGLLLCTLLPSLLNRTDQKISAQKRAGKYNMLFCLCFSVSSLIHYKGITVVILQQVSVPSQRENQYFDQTSYQNSREQAPKIQGGNFLQ